METFQALQLMFLFGMFILALLTFIQKNRSPSVKGCDLFLVVTS
ncbi:putative holin-like toxin [Paenibacillus larvae]|nr:putative holin-like toxin [Paenibacillus larvae]MDT2192418.1 putative holin-like toxin [Paenibacillus larvae]MDT2239713.1 putative holin-like toxin [Paenibacillus larvae]MDT2259268.1 putative holin-like toxin [Paenibacillus larvae]MDT2292934.1 putative holin-like toxin [Paenibacillus larvae]